MMLTPEEEEIAIEIRDILKPMSQVTKEICSEKSVTLSKCIPLISLLQKVNTIFILLSVSKIYYIKI